MRFKNKSKTNEKLNDAATLERHYGEYSN